MIHKALTNYACFMTVCDCYGLGIAKIMMFSVNKEL